MKVTIRNIEFSYDMNSEVTGVNLRFDIAENKVNFLNGFMQITNEEYLASTDLSQLEVLVLTKLKEKIDGALV